MINHGLVESTIRPDAVRADEHSVWISTEITLIEREELPLYQYQLTQYGKDEYTQLLSERNEAMELDLTDLQLALCELYEGMVI